MKINPSTASRGTNFTVKPASFRRVIRSLTRASSYRNQAEMTHVYIVHTERERGGEKEVKIFHSEKKETEIIVI